MKMDLRHVTKRLVPPTVLLAAGFLAACGGQRPLHVVREDGDWAVEHQQYDRAIADYSEYVDRKVGEVEVRYLLGRAYLASGDCKKAMESISTCVEVMPDSDEYAAGLAEALYTCNERDRLTLFLTRRTSERGTPADFILLGQYADKLGHPDEAIGALKTAAKIDQGRTLAPQLALADYYGARGDRTNQVTRLRMALYLAPTSRELNEKLRSMGEVIGPTLAMKPEEAE